mmetsp:Transcript_28437/g.47260  ORF Transcript_28437/g.47260 Transcript_28437/m.47260 type:complete len:105 (-) Transcript_28437:122-436(-)
MVDVGTNHLGCTCPDGWEGPHCELQVKGFSVTAVVQHATSGKSSGAIAGIVIGCFGAVALFLFVKERFIDKPKRERAKQLRPGMPGYVRTHEMASRRNMTRDII